MSLSERRAHRPACLIRLRAWGCRAGISISLSHSGGAARRCARAARSGLLTGATPTCYRQSGKVEIWARQVACSLQDLCASLALFSSFFFQRPLAAHLRCSGPAPLVRSPIHEAYPTGTPFFDDQGPNARPRGPGVHSNVVALALDSTPTPRRFLPRAPKARPAAAFTVSRTDNDPPLAGLP